MLKDKHQQLIQHLNDEKDELQLFAEETLLPFITGYPSLLFIAGAEPYHQSRVDGVIVEYHLQGLVDSGAIFFLPTSSSEVLLVGGGVHSQQEPDMERFVEKCTQHRLYPQLVKTTQRIKALRLKRDATRTAGKVQP